jgi:hypothetical protein
MGSRLLLVIDGALVSMEASTAGQLGPVRVARAEGTTADPPAGFGLDPADVSPDNLLDIIERLPIPDGPDPAAGGRDRTVRRTLWRLPP